jgi:hypothetical protein
VTSSSEAQPGGDIMGAGGFVFLVFWGWFGRLDCCNGSS